MMLQQFPKKPQSKQKVCYKTHLSSLSADVHWVPWRRRPEPLITSQSLQNMCSVSVVSKLVCQRSLCRQHTGLGLPALLELASRSARRVAISARPTNKSPRTAQAYKNAGAHSCASNWLR